MGSKHGTMKESQVERPVLQPRISNLPQSKDCKIIKALYDLESASKNSDELSFKKDELFKLVNRENEDWWLVESLVTKQKGFVPSNYVVDQDSIQEKAWFQGNISRKDCEKLLETALNIIGTFLIRESGSIEGTYSLSELCLSEGDRVVKHYHMRKMDSGRWYIAPKNSFESIENLIAFYSKTNGLCNKLTQPCPRFKPVMKELSRKMNDKWEIDRHSIQMIEKLGSGNFGEVWKGLWNRATVVAIKMLKPGVTEKDKFLEEASIMKRLRHPKLIRLYAVCTDGEPLYIITEYMTNGCLQELLKKDRGETITFHGILEISTQIASGMGYIESQGYIHRDLATRNILVDEYMLVKIGDFGLSKALISDDIYVAKEKTKFPVKWTAIEAVMSQRFTIKSDVWSFGILLIELVTYGATPYPGMTNVEVLNKLIGNYRHPKPSSCSDEMYELMVSCWHKDPSRRPTFEYLYNTLDDFYVATQSQYVE